MLLIEKTIFLEDVSIDFKYVGNIIFPVKYSEKFVLLAETGPNMPNIPDSFLEPYALS